MTLGDRVYVFGYVDEIRKDVVIIRNDSGYFGTEKHNIFVAETVKEMEAKSRWIPVSERLPDNQSAVLVTCKGLVFDSDVISIALYDDKEFYNFDGKKLDASAWQLLPKPYKGDADD